MRNEASSRDSAKKKDKTGYQRTERSGMREVGYWERGGSYSREEEHERKVRRKKGVKRGQERRQYNKDIEKGRRHERNKAK